MSLQEHRGQDTLDVIDEKVMQGEQFFERHGKKIMIGVGVIVLIALGIFAWLMPTVVFASMIWVSIRKR